ncbi:NAD(P)-binding protein, partial [Nocardia salmonicida]|uniref:NAD(P)-binding protein n=1 Tax=Nocardia salmonicida TaxID=53431 RepID=UPI003667F0B8
MHTCEPTQTPEVDRDALRARYLAERDKRIRPEGQQQYVEAEAEFAEYHESDPYTPVVARPPISQDIDVAILGGGLAGLVTAARITGAGVENFRIIEHAGDFGGAWYWNRYPGMAPRERSWVRSCSPDPPVGDSLPDPARLLDR